MYIHFDDDDDDDGDKMYYYTQKNGKFLCNADVLPENKQCIFKRQQKSMFIQRIRRMMAINLMPTKKKRHRERNTKTI